MCRVIGILRQHSYQFYQRRYGGDPQCNAEAAELKFCPMSQSCSCILKHSLVVRHSESTAMRQKENLFEMIIF